MLAKNSPVLKILNQKINMLSLSPEEKKLYESRMKLKSDIATYSEAEFNRGMKEGIINTARRMKNKNFDISIIMEMTGLTKEEIEKL